MIKRLFNPFTQVAGEKALLLGIVAWIVSSGLAVVFPTNFDGALDAHYGPVSEWYFPLLQNLVNILSLTLFMYVFALLFATSKTRFIDMIGTVSMARFPYVLMPLLNIGNISGSIGQKFVDTMLKQQTPQLSTSEISYMIFAGVVGVFLLIWTITLLYNAYTVSSNLKKTKAVISFIASLVFAEILSSIIIRTFLV